MLSATRRWVRRNRTNLALGAGIVGAGYVATQYVLGRISEARQRMSSDRIARENLRRRFQQNQEDCTFTVLALLPTATDNILAELQTERITFELQQQKAAKLARSDELQASEFGSAPPSITDDDGRSLASYQSESGVHASQISITSAPGTVDGTQEGTQAQRPRRTKKQLWNDLKISSITRAFSLLYTLSLLTLLTRIQLNLLGRRSYLSSVVSLATGPADASTISLENNDDDSFDQAYGSDFETNRRYLTFSWWLLHRGWKEVTLKVEAAVKEVFGPLSPRDDLTMEKFAELTLEVRRRVEGATQTDRQAKRWLPYLLPPREQEDFVLRESGVLNEPQPEIQAYTPPTTTLRRLLDETADLIDSPSFSHVLTRLLDAGFSTLVDTKLAQDAFKIPVVDPLSKVTEITEVKPVKLPIILATLTKQAHVIGNGVPNQYLQAMEQVGDLEAFAAVVYSSNWESELGPIEDDATAAPAASASGAARVAVKTAGLSATGTNLSDSLVDVGSASAFESAWGKAVGS